MNSLNIALSIGAGTVLFLAMISGYVKNRLSVSEPLICLGIGVLIGPLALDLASFDLTDDDTLMLVEQAARITLAIAVMGAAMRLPHGFVTRHWREMSLILSAGMLGMWLMSSLLAYLCFALPLLSALLLGAMITPTDPVLADSIVTSRTAEAVVPGRLRHLITAESGANDGLAILLVLLPVAFLEHDPAGAVQYWLLRVLLWEVLGAVLIGAAMGWVAGRCLVWAQRHPDSETASLTTVGLALSLTVLACVKLIGSDGILAVFAAGLGFNRFISHRETRQEHVQETIGRFFDLPVFILFGIILPWTAWGELGWPALLFVVAVLLLRRLPVWWLLRARLASLHTRRDTLFAGWFGPIGIAALFYASKIRYEHDMVELWNVASLVIFASIVLHGISATPLTRRYRKPGEEMVVEEESGRAVTEGGE